MAGLTKRKRNLRKKLADHKIIRTLILSDIFVLSGFGLISPILAVFFTEQVRGGGLGVAGLASTIFLLVKSGLILPIARFLDQTRGERDDFYAMLCGSVLISLVPFSYLVIKEPIQLYAVQMLYGLGAALSSPSWLAIFTRHIGKKKTGFTWGLYYTLTDVGGAITAGVGGMLADYVGFRPLFLLVGIMSAIGSATLLLFYKEVRKSR
jgi:DHA1 family quinolone resistance protein-like MFS transporter